MSCGVCNGWVWESRLGGGGATGGTELKCERGASFFELQRRSWDADKLAGGGGSGANEGIAEVLRTVLAGIHGLASALPQEVAGKLQDVVLKPLDSVASVL